MAERSAGFDRPLSETQLLAPVRWRLIRPAERPRWGQTLCAQHSLPHAHLVGQVLRSVATTPEGPWLALLGWSSAALHLRPRDRWIGWSEGQRAARLRLIAQNSRFLVLPERMQFPNLASRLSAVPGTGRRPGAVHPAPARGLARGLWPGRCSLSRLVVPAAIQAGSSRQNSALPGVRAKGTTSRMLLTPVRNISSRSKPTPKPACGTVP